MKRIFPTSLTVIALLLTLPLSAATEKRRAVDRSKVAGQPSVPPPVAEVIITGNVVDSVTDAPVVQAEVSAAAPNLSKFIRTTPEGVFMMRVAPGSTVTFTITRTGYQSSTTSVTVPAAMTQRFQLVPNPTVQVRSTNGTVYQLDADSVEFGYIVPFSGFTRDRKVSLCRSDGTAFTPDRNEFRRITGPAVAVTKGACCPNGSALAVNIELKTGDKTQAFFIDSCVGYAIELIGIEHTLAKAVDLKFSEIAEVVFP